ncbi:c2H2-type domain-containing protein [Trichonephila clavipes]|nr:c2H2-type domain-containing protein [Trichonephila clavipes]
MKEGLIAWSYECPKCNDRHDVTRSTIKSFLQNCTSHAEGKLKEGVSENFFLQDIREEITVDSGRKMLIEKKDIHNVKRDFNINGYVKRHEIDAVSVKLWAEEMKNNGENCIVFFSKSRDNQGMIIV